MKKPIGIHAHRLAPEQGNPREVAMVAEWDHLNEGGGEFFHDLLSPSIYPMKPTSREWVVAETIIQWLGSPVGMTFLGYALDRVGMEIRDKETGVDNPKDSG